jgi:hypothetical protein
MINETDIAMAKLARSLADALAKAGHSREPNDKLDVLRLQTELCRARRDEQMEAPPRGE